MLCGFYPAHTMQMPTILFFSCLLCTLCAEIDDVLFLPCLLCVPYQVRTLLVRIVLSAHYANADHALLFLFAFFTVCRYWCLLFLPCLHCTAHSAQPTVRRDGCLLSLLCLHGNAQCANIDVCSSLHSLISPRCENGLVGSSAREE